MEEDKKKQQDSEKQIKAFKQIADKKIFKFFKTNYNSISKSQLLDVYCLNDFISSPDQNLIQNIVFDVTKDDLSQKYIQIKITNVKRLGKSSLMLQLINCS